MNPSITTSPTPLTPSRSPKSEHPDSFGGFLERVLGLILICRERRILRRLYSTFAPGWPGLGLLLMRVVLGGALVWRAGPAIWSSGSSYASMTTIFLAGCGILVMAGLWMPIVGTCVSLAELWRWGSHLGDPTVAILLATISCALAMLGPGLWSIDARLFGWKRVEVPPHTSGRHTR